MLRRVPEMSGDRNGPDLKLLADIDPLVHASARLMILTYLYVVESADFV